MIGNWLWGAFGSILIFLVSLSTALHRKETRDKAVTQAVVAALNWCDSISPLDFERYCCEFLRLIGWRAETTKASGDQGADIIAWRDGVRVICQCKKYAKAVGNKAVQEAFSAKQFYRATAGAVISNAPFTRGARELAVATDIRLLHFTDLVHFSSIMIPGTSDIDPASLNPGEIQAESRFRSYQNALYVICIISVLIFTVCLSGAIDGLTRS